MFDNQIYGLTKQQTSPTSRKGLPTQTQPSFSGANPLGVTPITNDKPWLNLILYL